MCLWQSWEPFTGNRNPFFLFFPSSLPHSQYPMFAITPIEDPELFDVNVYRRTLGEFILLRNGAPALDDRTLESRGKCLAWVSQMELVRVSEVPPFF
jgi:hypothetical protein